MHQFLTFHCLKCHYDENHMFSIEAILRHKQVACMRRKMLLLFSNISFCSRDIQVFKICKLATQKKRVSCHGNKMFYSSRCVFRRIISPSSFNDLRCKLAKIALFIHMMLHWVECMTSSVISFAYFTHFSNLNISGINAGICKR